jgi:hypothetical protein
MKNKEQINDRSTPMEEEQITPVVKESNVFKIIIIIFLIILALLVIPKLTKKYENYQTEERRIESSSSKKNNMTIVPAIPAYYNEYPTLKKGEVIRVNVPSGYSYTCSGGGKKYYHQAQNSEKEIWGDGTYHKAGDNIAYFDLSYYDQEITVVCKFEKKY